VGSIRVVYDASVLGMSMLDPKARTGVFRVAEHLARGLLESPECELRLCAGGDGFHAIYGTLRYLEAHPAFRGVPFASAGAAERGRARLLRLTLAAMSRGGDGLPVKVARRLGAVASARLLRGDHRIDPSELQGADIFHSPHGPLPELSVPGVQRFLTVYDLIGIFRPELFEGRVGEYVERIVRSIRPDDWVTCISEATKADLCEYAGVRPERVFVTPLAASRTLFHPPTGSEEEAATRKRCGIPDGPYVLSLNTLEPRKNLATVVRAFARALAHGADLHLVLVGGKGWKMESLFEAIDETPGAQERIVFAGYVADEDLAAIYGGALAFLYPSLWEGFGLPVLEAMQCGVPVLASNTSAIPEVVGDAGVMADPMEADAFADALLRIHDDSEYRDDLARRALLRADEFSWERTIRETIGAYRVALDP
jgi:glycosyltransferase involved in cell wall biosynthesis